MTTIFQVRLFFSYLLCAQKNLSRIDSFFTLCKSIQLTICDMSRVLHFLCLVFLWALEFHCFYRVVRKKINRVLCVCLSTTHTHPNMAVTSGKEGSTTLGDHFARRCGAKAALHMAKNFSANWCNGRSFTHLMGSSTLSFKAKHKNKWEAMTAMAIDHNGAHLRNSYFKRNKIFDWFFRALKSPSPQIQFSRCLPYLALL